MLLTALACLPPHASMVAPPDGGTLRAVVILSRHGVRTPDMRVHDFAPFTPLRFPTDLAAWGANGTAQLTPHGYAAVREMGRFYASEARYRRLMEGVRRPEVSTSAIELTANWWSAEATLDFFCERAPVRVCDVARVIARSGEAAQDLVVVAEGNVVVQVHGAVDAGDVHAGACFGGHPDMHTASFKAEALSALVTLPAAHVVEFFKRVYADLGPVQEGTSPPPPRRLPTVVTDSHARMHAGPTQWH